MTADAPAHLRTPAPLSTPEQPALGFMIHVAPDWARIEQIRECVVGAIEAAYAPVLVGDQTGIVVSELLENAIKYGIAAPSVLKIDGDAEQIVVAVTNQFDPARASAESLSAHVAWIESFPDPQEAYMACLTLAFQRTGTNPAGSGLGLARIRYEGGCTISLQCPTPGRLTVVARQPVEWAAPSRGA